ncbi:MAG: YHS domain-containing protein [Desulfobacteraceae bacterium]|nr:YHS domain-containing protein [Desulfobacteraceae bacterium]
MIRLLFWLLLIYIGYRVLIALTTGKKQDPGRHSAASEGTETFRDPVCGMYVSEEDAVVGKLEGQRHYFCSMDCLEKFREQLGHTPRS